MNHRFPSRLYVDAFWTVNRRTLLRDLVPLPWAQPRAAFSRGRLGQSRFAASPFALGVAAGDPALDGFVLWTKLAP